jgi:hypothetical protein
VAVADEDGGFVHEKTSSFFRQFLVVAARIHGLILRDCKFKAARLWQNLLGLRSGFFHSPCLTDRSTAKCRAVV